MTHLWTLAVLHLIVMSSVETMRFSTFKNKRIPKNNLQRVHATNNSCECLQTCRIHSFCYGASYGIMYTSSSVGIQLGTLGICHITINPTVPKNLETSSGYTTMIMGSTDSGCEEAYGFSNMGPAGCIRLVSTAAKRSDAIDACKKVGGVLAVLSTEQAYNVVVKALTRIDAQLSHYWVAASEGLLSWKWETGDSVIDDFWASGEPNTGEYAVMNANFDFKLSSTSDSSYGYVCQKPIDFS